MTRSFRHILAAFACLASTTLFAQSTPAPARHDIDVVLKPASGAITINDRVELEGRPRYRFRLAPWLEIYSLEVDGEMAKAQRQGHEQVVNLPDDRRHVVEFKLRGLLPTRGQGGEANMQSSSGPDGVYLPGYDDWIPYASEPISYRLRVTVPQPQRAVATGKLIDEINDGDFYQAVFEVAQAAEPPSLFAGPYRIGERITDGLRLRTYFHAELVDLSDIYLDAAAGYIQRYSQSIGDYPYADFHMISAPLPVGLGFPNLTYVGRRVLPLPFMRGRSLAHEVLHNWWGTGVMVDYASGNWAEGLTTFMADYALQRDQGKAAARGMRIKWLRDYAALPANRDRPVRAFTSKQHQASQVIGYNKVAFIFHMLQLEIGGSAFDAGLRLFWQRHKHGTAGWRELRSAFEQAAGRDLGWYFTQWLDRRGAPRPGLGAHRVSRVDDGYVISVEILQPVSGYRFRLPVLLATANGRERHEITISDSLTRVEWKTSAKPEFIHFDPDSDVFRRLQRSETPPILRDVTLNAGAVCVIAAEDEAFAGTARELAAKLMDVAPRFSTLPVDGAIEQPLLLVTTNDRLDAQLARLNLKRPAGLPTVSHSAAAWTTRLASGHPLLVVSADDAAALQSLLRPLPHYGGQSYVLFAAGRAVERGVWPVTRGPLYLDLRGG